MLKDLSYGPVVGDLCPHFDQLIGVEAERAERTNCIGSRFTGGGVREVCGRDQRADVGFDAIDPARATRLGAIQESRATAPALGHRSYTVPR